MSRSDELVSRKSRKTEELISLDFVSVVPVNQEGPDPNFSFSLALTEINEGIKDLKTEFQAISSATNKKLELQVSELIAKFDQTHMRPDEKKRSEAQQYEKLEVHHPEHPNIIAAKLARSVEGLRELLPNWDYHYKDDVSKEQDHPNGIFCTDCLKLKSNDVSEGNKPGVVHYNFDTGEDFTRAKILPRDFSNFKKNIIEHMGSSIHQHNRN